MLYSIIGNIDSNEKRKLFLLSRLLTKVVCMIDWAKMPFKLTKNIEHKAV